MWLKNVKSTTRTASADLYVIAYSNWWCKFSLNLLVPSDKSERNYVYTRRVRPFGRSFKVDLWESSLISFLIGFHSRVFFSNSIYLNSLFTKNWVCFLFNTCWIFGMQFEIGYQRFSFFRRPRQSPDLLNRKSRS